MSLMKMLKNRYQAGVTPQFMDKPPANANVQELIKWKKWKSLYDAGKITDLYEDWKYEDNK
jgi:hypothetical protein